MFSSINIADCGGDQKVAVIPAGNFKDSGS
jgi:hypothetical protein